VAKHFEKKTVIELTCRIVNSESHTGSKIYKSKLVLMITICRNTQRTTKKITEDMDISLTFNCKHSNVQECKERVDFLLLFYFFAVSIGIFSCYFISLLFL